MHLYTNHILLINFRATMLRTGTTHATTTNANKDSYTKNIHCTFISKTCFHRMDPCEAEHKQLQLCSISFIQPQLEATSDPHRSILTISHPRPISL